MSFPPEHELIQDTPREDIDSGYYYVCRANHPLATVNGRVRYHRYIASIKEGRWLLPEEHVHHLDGDKSNNLPDNLIVLTNEEHTKLHQQELVEIKCKWCNSLFLPDNKRDKFCSRKCYNTSNRKWEIEVDVLKELVWKKPVVHLAKELGVSGTAIKKRCKQYGISTPPRGYWAKLNADVA